MKFPTRLLFGIFFTALLFAPSIVLAANWYVDNAATGANNGTSWTNAWRSFSAINWNSILPGDTVYISGGTASKTYTERFEIKKSGTALSRITVRVGQNAGHNGTAIIDASGTINWALAVAGNYVTVDGEYAGQRHLVVRNAPTNKEGTAIALDGTVDPLLRFIEVDTAGIGIVFAGGSGGVIERSYIHGIRGDTGIRCNARNGAASQYDLTFIRYNEIQLNSALNTGSGPDGIQGCRGLTIHDNQIYNAPGPSNSPDQTNHSDLIQVQADYVKIYNNVLSNMTDSGIDLDQWTDAAIRHIRIYNNILRGVNGSSTGMRFYTSGVPLTSILDVHIMNNTFVDLAEIGDGNAVRFTFGGGNPTVSDVEIKNNIFYNSGKASPYHDVITILNSSNASQSDWNVDYNLVNAGPRGSATLVVDGAVFTQAHGQNGPPTFVTYSPASPNNDFRLGSSDTSARDRGVNLASFFTTDKDGTNRPHGLAWDIGAYEYGSTGGGGTLIYGQCGSAAKTYSATETFPNGAYCATGTPSPTAPTNPAPGNSTTWQCLGTNGGANASCTATKQSSTLPTNQPPTVSITSPRIGQNFPTATAAVTVNVSALDVDGMARVDFYDGNVFYGRDDDASCENGGTSCSYPSFFSFTFGDLKAGAGGAAVSHTLRAVAYDNQGTSASAAVIITVGTLMSSGYKSATGGSSDVPPCEAPTSVDLKNVIGPCPVLSVSNPTDANAPVTIGLAVQPRQYVWNTIFVTDISNPKIKKWIPKTIPSCGTDGWCTSSDGTGHTLTLTPTALSALGGTGVHYVASWDWTWNGTCWLGPGTTSCDTPGKWRVQKFEVR